MKKFGLYLVLYLGSVFLASCASSESLAAPSGLTIKTGINKVDLSWQDNSDNEEGFRVFRKLEGEASFTELQDTAPNTETYTDDVSSSGRYVYAVRAFAPNGNVSAPAAIGEAVAVTILVTPTDLTATPEEGQIALTWTDASDNEEGFRIFRRLESDTSFSPDLLTTVDANVVSYSDTAVSLGESYVYQVIAFAGSSVSEASSPSAPATPSEPNPNPEPEPEPEPVVESLEGEWRGQLEGIGDVELSVDEDLDPNENSQRNFARFTYLNEDQTKFIFECRGTGPTFKCTEFAIVTEENLGDSGYVINGEFVAEGQISGTFKNPFQEEAQALTLERVAEQN